MLTDVKFKKFAFPKKKLKYCKVEQRGENTKRNIIKQTQQ